MRLRRRDVRPVSYAAPGELSSPRFARAFAAGCHGHVSFLPALEPGPVALFGSPARWPLLRDAMAAGRTFYYADHAYFLHTRKRYYRVTRNGYQHDGRGAATPARYRATGGPTIRPWRQTGRHIVVCPNSATYFALHGLDVHAWLDGVTTTLRAHTDREIRIRWKADAADRPLAADLVDAWAVVVFSSASAIEALIAGVPVFVLAPWAAPARMGLSDLTAIETPIYPDDREPFVWNLAHQQWTLDEIAAGYAWHALAEEGTTCVA